MSNDTWFLDAYHANNAVRFSNEDDATCGGQCRQAHECAIQNVDYDDYRMCATQAKALSANGACAGGAGVVARVLVVAVVGWGKI